MNAPTSGNLSSMSSWSLQSEPNGTRLFSKPSPRIVGKVIFKLIGPALPLEGRDPFLPYAQRLADAHAIEVVEWTAPGDSAGAPLGFGLRAIRSPRLVDAHAAYAFAHETAHHVLGHAHTAPVWRTEIEADSWAVASLEAEGLLTEGVRASAHRHLATRLLQSLRSSQNPEALAGKIARRLPPWFDEGTRSHIMDLADPYTAADRVRGKFFGPGLGRKERMEAFEEWWFDRDEPLDGVRLGGIVREVWIDTELPWALQEVWEDVWSLSYIDVMTVEEKDALAELSDPVEVFRGFTARPDAEDPPPWWGLSWTLNRSKAEWFARRFSADGDGCVARAKVPKKLIRALLLERNESEVVVLPWAIEADVSVEPVSDDPT